MSQIMFNNGGMRNIGANGNQPLITNQNDFQFFDNVTRVAGKHTMKTGGSFTHRSREILNADTIVGRFDFNQNLTSSCAGITSGCTVAANTGFDFASFLLGYAQQSPAGRCSIRAPTPSCGRSSPPTSRTTSA